MGLWTDYVQKELPEDDDTLLVYDSTGQENKQVTLSNLHNYEKKKLEEALFDLDTESKTLPGATNELKEKSDQNDSKLKKIENGEIAVGESKKVNGHTVESDVPENATFTDTVYNDEEIKEELSNLEEKIDNIENGSTSVGNSKKVNGHTVESNVPKNAKFTDTVYDDSDIRKNVSDLEKTLTERFRNLSFSINQEDKGLDIIISEG